MNRELRPRRRQRRMSRTVAPVLFGALTALVVAPPACAEKADRDKPINFSGDAGDADLQTRGGALTGNVIITQGTLTLRADRIVFKQNPDNSLSATAYGNPVAIRQKRDDVDEYYEGYARRIEYDGSKDLVELFDNALLKRGQDEIRSNYVSYNVAKELFKAEGRAGTTPDPSGPGTRVRGMFQPKSDLALPGKDKDAPKDAGKGAAKGQAPSASEAPLTLKPAGELTPPAAK